MKFHERYQYHNHHSLTIQQDKSIMHLNSQSPCFVQDVDRDENTIIILVNNKKYTT